MRRPVRTMTFPSTSSRRIRFGDPTSSEPSGVTVAALRPKPGGLHGLRRLGHARVVGLPPALEGEVVALQGDVEPEELRVEHAQRLLEELLAGLVALEDDDLEGLLGHRPPA